MTKKIKGIKLRDQEKRVAAEREKEQSTWMEANNRWIGQSKR